MSLGIILLMVIDGCGDDADSADEDHDGVCSSLENEPSSIVFSEGGMHDMNWDRQRVHMRARVKTQRVFLSLPVATG